MSNFNIIGLDDLLQHGKTTENTLVVNVINKFVEDLTKELLNVTDEVIELTVSDDCTYASGVFNFIEGVDIFIYYELEYYVEDGGASMMFNKLRINIMNNQFELIGTDIEELMESKMVVS